MAERLVMKRAIVDIRGEEIVDEEVRDYLEGFPSYSSEPERYEAVFKSLADWLVADGGERNGDDDGATIREVLHILAAYEHLQNKIVNRERGWRLRRHDYNNLGSFLHGAYTLIWAREQGNVLPPLAPCGFPEGVRTTVILFGVFQVEDISLPIDFNDMTKRFLFADPCEEVQRVRADDGKGSAFWDIPRFLPYHGTAGTYSPPDALLNFFSYVLRKFNYKFSEEAFIEDDDLGSETDMPFESFGWPVLFCDGEWGDCLLVDGMDN